MWQRMRGTVVLGYAIKFCLCAVILCCAGCGVSQQAQVTQKTPERLILQAEAQRREVRLSFADAYPENWEHQLSRRDRLSR